ncbi:unnamed protein product, partial [Amoebophrya sp. A25]
NATQPDAVAVAERRQPLQRAVAGSSFCLISKCGHGCSGPRFQAQAQRKPVNAFSVVGATSKCFSSTCGQPVAPSSKSDNVHPVSRSSCSTRSAVCDTHGVQRFLFETPARIPRPRTTQKSDEGYNLHPVRQGAKVPEPGAPSHDVSGLCCNLSQPSSSTTTHSVNGHDYDHEKQSAKHLAVADSGEPRNQIETANALEPKALLSAPGADRLETTDYPQRQGVSSKVEKTSAAAPAQKPTASAARTKWIAKGSLSLAADLASIFRNTNEASHSQKEHGSAVDVILHEAENSSAVEDEGVEQRLQLYHHAPDANTDQN